MALAALALSTNRQRYHSARPPRSRSPCAMPVPRNQWNRSGSTGPIGLGSKNIGLYRVLFTENHLAIRFDDGLARSSAAALQELEDMVGARLPATCVEGEAKRVATAIWAGLHGTALLASGRLIPVGGPREEGRAEVEGTAIARLLIERFSKPKRPARRRVTGRS